MRESKLEARSGLAASRKTALKTKDERRATKRFTFAATAEALDVGTSTRLVGRVSDLSLGGCYIDLMTPFGPGTRVRLRISYNSQSVDVDGAVRFSHAGLGMGVGFDSLAPAQLEMLSSWIAYVSGERAVPAQLPSFQGELQLRVEEKATSDRKILEALLRLLVAKGILTATEASELMAKS